MTATRREVGVAAARWVPPVLTMRPDAMVISGWSYSTPLWYAQHIEGQRPDLAVIDDRTRLELGLGDVTDVIEQRYVLEYLEGPDARFLTRVVARREPAE